MHTARLTSLAGLTFMLPAIFPLASAQQGQPVAGYRLLNTITIPTGLAGNDISWVDSANARYYLADRGNAAATPVIGPRVDVIDTQANIFLTSIPLSSAANGILAVPRSHEIWVGLNDSTIAVIDTSNNTITHVINLGGTARADEMAYDPADRIILIANDRDTPPFVKLRIASCIFGAEENKLRRRFRPEIDRRHRTTRMECRDGKVLHLNTSHRRQPQWGV